MTLHTVTYDTATHKIVPIEPTIEMKLAFEVGMSMFLGNDESLKLAIAVAPEYQEPENQLDMPLPCDVKVGHGTIKKGCKLSTLVLRMNVLYDLAMKNQEPTKSMICQRCGADRFKEPCKQQDMNCPIVATAHTTKGE